MKPGNKQRIDLQVDRETKRRLLALMVHYRATSMAEVLRRIIDRAYIKIQGTK